MEWLAILLLGRHPMSAVLVRKRVELEVGRRSGGQSLLARLLRFVSFVHGFNTWVLGQRLSRLSRLSSVSSTYSRALYSLIHFIIALIIAPVVAQNILYFLYDSKRILGPLRPTDKRPMRPIHRGRHSPPPPSPSTLPALKLGRMRWLRVFPSYNGDYMGHSDAPTSVCCRQVACKTGSSTGRVVTS